MHVIKYVSVRIPATVFLILLLGLTASSVLHAQKGKIEECEVSEFDPPFTVLSVDYFGVEQPFIIDGKTAFRGQKKRKIDPREIVEGTIILSLEYEIRGEDWVAKTVTTDISADGSIRISGLFEGMQDGAAIIDGYPVYLRPGVMLEGSSKTNKCECKGLVVPTFDHPLVEPGNYYVEVQGKLEDNGTVSASKATLCRNTFGGPERDLLEAVNSSLTNNTKRITQVPNGVFNPSMGLYNGEIKVGQYSYQMTDDIKLQGYINQIGNRLLPEHTEDEQLADGPVNYRFYVIDDPIPNAFAFPNGMIFVHTGLLDIIDNEAQLAVVLGHEIAHVTHEHGRKRYETNNIVSTGSVILGKLTQTAKFSRFMGQTVGGLSPQLLNSLGQVSLAFTPEAISNIVQPQPQLESQADRVGLYYAYEAGYDIREAAGFWDKMAELTGRPDFQAQVTNDLIGALASPRFSLDGNLVANLGAAGSEVLARQLLNTIYTSHPKAKKRATMVNKLVGTVYQAETWEEASVKQERYLEMVGRK